MLSVLLTKFADLGVAKTAAALGTTAALVVATGAAAGAVTLPQVGQDRPAASQAGSAQIADSKVATDGGVASDTAGRPDKPAKDNHGQRVSELARSGAGGKAVSELARQQGKAQRDEDEGTEDEAAKDKAAQEQAKADAAAERAAEKQKAAEQRAADKAARAEAERTEAEQEPAAKSNERPAPAAPGNASDKGETNSSGGRSTASNAPTQDAPAGTPSEGRRP